MSMVRHIFLLFALCVAVFGASQNFSAALAQSSSKEKAQKKGQRVSSSDIKKRIEEEQLKAEVRKENMQKLTEKERSINTTLAEAEDRMKAMEQNIGNQESEFSKLEAAQGINRRQYDDLTNQRGRTEESLSGLIEFLWPIYVGQESVGSRDGLAFVEAERDYLWIAEIIRQTYVHQTELREQESAISNSLARKESLALQLRNQIEAINKDKESLLADKLRFRQELSELRQEKEDSETELKGVLSTIQGLNIGLERAVAFESRPPDPPVADPAVAESPTANPSGAESSPSATSGLGRKTPASDSDSSPVPPAASTPPDAATAARIGSGKLPWPAAGKIVAVYAPSASPPVNGIGLALNKGDVVRSIAWGKVVHNDMLRGLGRVVVVMHDKSYYTVYAYLAESSVKMGQNVNEGQVVGVAGYYPGAKGPGTYFELRYHQKPVNPASWLVAHR